MALLLCISPRNRTQRLKSSYFPGSVDVLLMIMKPSSSNSRGNRPKIRAGYSQVYVSEGFVFTTMSAK